MFNWPDQLNGFFYATITDKNIGVQKIVFWSVVANENEILLVYGYHRQTIFIAISRIMQKLPQYVK